MLSWDRDRAGGLSGEGRAFLAETQGAFKLANSTNLMVENEGAAWWRCCRQISAPVSAVQESALPF